MGTTKLLLLDSLLQETCLSPQDGPAYHLPEEVVLQHQEQQEEGGQNSWWQAGVPVLEEAPFRAQVPHDWPQTEGCHSSHQPGEGSHVQKAEDSLQGLWWSVEPQGREGEDRESLPH